MILGVARVHQAIELGDGDTNRYARCQLPQRTTSWSAVKVDAVGLISRILIKHGDDVRTAIVFKADVCDLSLGEELLRALRNGTFGMLTDFGRPLVGCLTHA